MLEKYNDYFLVVSAAALAAESIFAAALSTVLLTAFAALSAAADAEVAVVSALTSVDDELLLHAAKIAVAARIANTFFIVLVV